jgi:hypothetical protein
MKQKGCHLIYSKSLYIDIWHSNAGFQKLINIRHLINGGLLCPLLRSSGLHHDTSWVAGPNQSEQLISGGDVSIVAVTVTCFVFGETKRMRKEKHELNSKRRSL